MITFLTLLMVGILLSIVGASVEGFLWLTVPGVLAFLGAVAYALLSSRPSQHNGTSRNDVDFKVLAAAPSAGPTAAARPGAARDTVVR